MFKLITPASQIVTILLLICLASCVETSVCSTGVGVGRSEEPHVANTTSAQTTSSSAPTQHSGLGRLAMTFMVTGENQLWAGDALAQLSTAAIPGTHQPFTLMR